jgi:hypothetical protein
MSVEDLFDENKHSSEVQNSHSGALDHAWNWFKYHAEQRIAMFKFYIVVVGAVAVGLGSLLEKKELLLGATLSIFLAIISFCFLRIDQRTSDLIKLGERALLSEQKRLAIMTQNDDFNICLFAERKSGVWPQSYGQSVKVLLILTIIFSLGFGIIFLYNSEAISSALGIVVGK